MTTVTADDWTTTWQPMLDAVGTDLSKGRVVRAADPIERSTVRRYLEPLEFEIDPDQLPDDSVVVDNEHPAGLA